MSKENKGFDVLRKMIEEATKKLVDDCGDCDHCHKQNEGEWEMQEFPLTKCSVCGTVRNCEKERGWKFCPECGAKMKGGA